MSPGSWVLSVLKLVRWTGTIAAGIGAVVVGALWYFQRALIFPRPGKEHAMRIRHGKEIIIELDTNEQRPAGVGPRIVGCYFPPRRADDWTLVFWHGNADQIGNVGDILGHQLNQDHGYGFLAIEYPGYALSHIGEPTEKSIIWSSDKMMRYMVSDLKLRPDRICAFGQSIGTAVAAQMAARGHAKKLIMLSPFTSIPHMCQALFPFVPNPSILISDPFNTLAIVPHLDTPTLIFHGNRDEIVPFSQGQTLAKAFNPLNRPRFIPLQGCGHNDTFAGPHYNTILRELKSFLAATPS